MVVYSYSQEKDLSADIGSIKPKVFYDYDTGKYGLLNESTNDTILKSKYDIINISNNKKYALVGEEDSFGAYNMEGKEIIPTKFASISDQGNFIMVVSKNNFFGLYNQVGKEITPVEYGFLGKISEGKIRANIKGKAVWYERGIFSDKSVEVTGGNWIFLDTTGKKISKVNLTYAKDFENGIAQVYIGGQNNDWVYEGKWTFLKSDGSLLLNDANEISDPVDGLFVAISEKPIGTRSSKRFLKRNEPPFSGVIDNQGKVVIPFIYDEISVFSHEFIKCTYSEINENDQEVKITIVLNEKGKKSFDFEIKQIKKQGNHIYALSNDGYGIYGLNGEEIFSPQFQVIKKFNEKSSSLLVGKKTENGIKYGLINTKGETLIKTENDNIWYDRQYDNVVISKNGQKHSCYINNKKIFTVECDSILGMGPKRVFDEALFQIETPTQSLIYNGNGEKIFDMPGVKIIHTTEIIENGQNVFVGVKNGKQGLVKLDQEILIPFKFDRLVEWTTLEDHYDDLQYRYKDNLIEATYDGKKTVINRKGKILIPPIEGDFSIDISPYGWKENRITISSKEHGYAKENIYGVIDTLGNIIVHPKWKYRVSFFNGNDDYYIVRRDNYDYSHEIYKIGKKEPIYQFTSIATGYKVKIFICEINEKWFILDIYSMTLSNKYFDELEDKDFYCDLSIVTVDGKKGIIDIAGNYLLKPIYEKLEPRTACWITRYHSENGQEYAAQLKGKWGGITTKGKKLTEFIYNSAEAVWESDGDFYRDY